MGEVPGRPEGGQLLLFPVLFVVSRISSGLAARHAENPSRRRETLCDFCGPTVDVINVATAQVHAARIFVAA